MKKKNLILCLVLAISMICSLTATSFAADGTGAVTFTSDSKMVENFGKAADTLGNMEPGDKATFSVTMKNENKNSTEWYMENKVLDTLNDISEATKKDGGLYTYKLTYNGPTGKTELVNSDKIGGKAGSEGLKEATNGLDNWFYVGKLESGQSGSVTLEVALDPETQGNSYQSKAAEMSMKFAVEEQTPGSSQKIVKTGDETNLAMWIALMAGSILLLAVSLFLIVKRRKEEKDEEHC